MDKRFWGVVLVIIVIFGGIFWATNHKSNPSDSGKNSQPTSHIEGNSKTGVTLVEYGDYQCPGCGQYFQTVHDVAAKYDKQISFQFRNFPLTQLHPNAFAGARAAEAANLQGKFWEMHDLLYQQNVAYYNSGQKLSTWINASDPLNSFTQYAQQLGLNVTQFKQDYAGEKVNNLVNADEAAGNKLGVDSTPTFFLNGQKVQPSPTPDSFAKLIDAAIKSASKQ
jgi:protein-disulfide isomerase